MGKVTRSFEKVSVHLNRKKIIVEVDFSAASPWGGRTSGGSSWGPCTEQRWIFHVAELRVIGICCRQFTRVTRVFPQMGWLDESSSWLSTECTVWSAQVRASLITETFYAWKGADLGNAAKKSTAQGFAAFWCWCCYFLGASVGFNLDPFHYCFCAYSVWVGKAASEWNRTAFDEGWNWDK